MLSFFCAKKIGITALKQDTYLFAPWPNKAYRHFILKALQIYKKSAENFLNNFFFINFGINYMY